MSPSEAGGGAGDLNTFAQHANLYVLNVFYVFAQHARSLVISLDGVWFVGVKTWVSVFDVQPIQLINSLWNRATANATATP